MVYPLAQSETKSHPCLESLARRLDRVSQSPPIPQQRLMDDVDELSIRLRIERGRQKSRRNELLDERRTFDVFANQLPPRNGSPHVALRMVVQRHFCEVRE